MKTLGITILTGLFGLLIYATWPNGAPPCRPGSVESLFTSCGK